MSQSSRNRQTPTLKTIAEISGLAVTTVSRALGDASDIAESTKLRVRQIAKEIGYIPNRAGVRLRTGRTQVIALVLPVERNMSSHSTRLTNSIAEALRHTQYNLNVTHWFDDEDWMVPIRRIVETRMADGIILNSTQEEDPRIQYLMECGFPFASHGRTKWAKEHYYFDYDNAEFARLAVAQLAARGRKRIGLILPPQTQFYSKHFREGAIMGANENGVELELFDGINADSHTRTVEAYMRDALARDFKIDAIIASSAASCMATVSAIESFGKTVGKEIDMYSREAMRFLHLFRPNIMLVREDVGKAGNFLGGAILHAIENPDAAPMQYLDTPKYEDMVIGGERNT